jgi:transposase
VSHRNARLTVHGRRTIVERVLIQGRPRSHVAKEMGVSRQCVSRWIARYQAEGEPGLQERSSRPRSSPERTSDTVEDRVLAVREQQRRGQDWIGPELGIPARRVADPAPPPGALSAGAGPHDR